MGPIVWEQSASWAIADTKITTMREAGQEIMTGDVPGPPRGDVPSPPAKILCDRCTRELQVIGDTPVPPRVEDIVIANLPSVPLRDFRYVPRESAVYFAISEERICYVGQAADINHRWRHHFIFPRLVAQPMPRIAWCVVRDQDQRKQLERDAIRHFRPLWNRGGAEHVSFPESNARWPRISGNGPRRAEYIRQLLRYPTGASK